MNLYAIFRFHGCGFYPQGIRHERILFNEPKEDLEGILMGQLHPASGLTLDRAFSGAICLLTDRLAGKRRCAAILGSSFRRVLPVPGQTIQRNYLWRMLPCPLLPRWIPFRHPERCQRWNRPFHNG